MKNKMSKKGAEYDLGRKVPYYMVVLFILAIVLFYVASMFIKHQSNIKIDFSKAEELSYVNTAVHCLSDNENSITHFGLIDTKKFNDETLQKCFNNPLMMKYDDIIITPRILVRFDGLTIKTLDVDMDNAHNYIRYVKIKGKEKDDFKPLEIWFEKNE